MNGFYYNTTIGCGQPPKSILFGPKRKQSGFVVHIAISGNLCYSLKSPSRHLLSKKGGDALEGVLYLIAGALIDFVIGIARHVVCKCIDKKSEKG